MAMHHAEGTPTGHEGHEHHVLPLKVYVGVYLTLLVLTYITVQVSFLGLGVLALPVAMIVAVIKAGFVVGFFMHLRYDDRFFSLVFFSSMFFIAVFFSFTLADLMTRGKLTYEHQNFSPLLEKTKVSASLGGHAYALTAHEAMAANKHKQPAHKHAAPAARHAAPVARHAVPVAAYKAPPAAVLAAGKTKYTQLCALCHGATGMGDGPGAKGLKIKPPAYGKGVFRLSGGTFAGIMKVIKNGNMKNGMAAYGWIPKKDRTALARYILHLAHLGTKGKTKAPVVKAPKAPKAASVHRVAAKPKKPAYKPAPAAVLAVGKAKFTQLCALCHGATGMGDGPGAKGLKVKPPAYGKGVFRLSGGTFAGLMKVIKNGNMKNGMAAYGWMPKKDRAALAHYILHLAHQGTK